MASKTLSAAQARISTIDDEIKALQDERADLQKAVKALEGNAALATLLDSLSGTRASASPTAAKPAASSGSGRKQPVRVADEQILNAFKGASDGVTATDLATSLPITTATAANRLKRLEKDGKIKRADDDGQRKPYVLA